MLPDHKELIRLYAYPEPPPGNGWVRACMITSLDGSAVGNDGLTGPLSTVADRRIMRLLRGLSDVMLVGAGTVRSEGYGLPDLLPEFVGDRTLLGQPAATSIAVVTNSGKLPENLVADLRLDPTQPGHRSEAPLIVLTSQAADPQALETLRQQLGQEAVIVCGESAVEPKKAIQALTRLGLRRILCEGGPELLGQFAAAGEVDELAVTIAPRLIGGEGPRIMHGAPVELDLELSRLLEDDGTLLTLWRVRTTADPEQN